jgi:hypothetical protein
MAHTIRCGRAKGDRCKCVCDGFYHGEQATELDRTDPEPRDPNPAPILPDEEPPRVRPLTWPPTWKPHGRQQLPFTYA